jgi:hypothetical protein
MKLTANDLELDDFTAIDSGKRLRGAILHACRILRREGHDEVAEEFESKVRRMPAMMITKEIINIVLLDFCWQLQSLGILESSGMAPADDCMAVFARG